jgi:TonB-dependent starch-binding outer membrane protein SusC
MFNLKLYKIMKNKPNPDILLPQNVKKIFLTMKISFLLIMFSVINVYASSIFSQNATISVHMQNVTIREVVGEIKKQGGISFVFNDNLQELDRRVSISHVDQPIQDVLYSALDQANMRYEIVGENFFVILPKPEYLKLQDISISGMVTDIHNQPLPGVTVVMKGTTMGATTNAEGYYSLSNIPDDAILVFSFVGMLTQEVAVGDQTVINLTMEEDFIGIEEVVAIGYGTMRRRNLTGSISSISVSEFENKAVTTPTELLLGTIAGLNYDLRASAKPGEGMHVRGISSISASNQPLIVVDGVIYNGSFIDINPNDIASIDVLKDASAASVYGSRAANGVVVITTKTGRTEKPVIRFDMKQGLAKINRFQRPYSPDEYLVARKYANMGLFPNAPPYYYHDPRVLPPEIDLETWHYYDGETNVEPVEVWLNRLMLQPIEIENFLAGKSIDWYDETFQTGLRHDYNLSISGASDNLNYYWSVGSASNEGVVVNESYKNIRSRINLRYNVTNYLQVGLNANAAFEDNGDRSAAWSRAVNASPYGEIYNPDGSYKWFPHEDNMAHNPLELTDYDVMDERQTFNGVIFAKLDLPFGFNYEINFSNRWRWRQDYEYRPISTRSGHGDTGYADRGDSRLHEWQIDNILRWNKTIADIHQFDLTLLYNAEQFQGYSSRAINSGFIISEDMSYHGIGIGNLPIVSADDTYETGNAFMARLNYFLAERYLFTLAFRRDGYSAFGRSNPYANFPSAAFAWVLSDEPFINVPGWLDNLKLRLSWGVNGNRDIGRYTALSRLRESTYLIGGQTVIGLSPINLANEELKWERTTSYNLGLDVGFFGHRVVATLDAYNMSTHDLLLTRALPDITGYENVMANLGEVANKGFEATVSSNNINGINFEWKSRLLFSMNRNEIKSLYGDMIDILDDEGNVIGQREDDDIENGWYIGHALDAIYDYKVIGIWQENEAEEAFTYSRFPGDFKLLDVDGSGYLLPETDYVWLGHTLPRYRISLANTFMLYNNIEISFLLRANLGHLGTNNNLKNRNFHERINNYNYPYWTPENPSNEYPRQYSVTSPPGFTVYRDRSFMRLQDLSIAYILPQELTNRLRIEHARVYFNVSNVYSFDTWELWDPETNQPTPMISTLGLSLTL